MTEIIILLYTDCLPAGIELFSCWNSSWMLWVWKLAFLHHHLSAASPLNLTLRDDNQKCFSSWKRTSQESDLILIRHWNHHDQVRPEMWRLPWSILGDWNTWNTWNTYNFDNWSSALWFPCNHYTALHLSYACQRSSWWWKILPASQDIN